MENRKPTEEEKVVELWEAYKQEGLAGIEKVGHQRNEEYRRETEKRHPELADPLLP